MIGRRKLIVGLALAVGVCAGDIVWAQRVPIEAIAGSTLVARLRWVQFDVVSGRLVATPLHLGTTLSTSTTVNDRRESLSIDLSNASPNIRYEMSAPGEELRIETQDGTQFLLRRVRRNDEVTTQVELMQPATDEGLTLSITRDGLTRTHRRATVWHLLLEEPDATVELLGPLFELMRPGWKIASQMEAAERSLCEAARFRRSSNVQLWAKAVSQLASAKYPERTAAERELLSAGRDVLPYLRSLNRELLDAEQRRRIRFVIESLDSNEGDTAEQIVALLSPDPVAWLSLLNRPELAKRKLAYEQLTYLLDRPVEFDPNGDEAVRAEQLNLLREQLVR